MSAHDAVPGNLGPAPKLAGVASLPPDEVLAGLPSADQVIKDTT